MSDRVRRTTTVEVDVVPRPTMGRVVFVGLEEGQFAMAHVTKVNDDGTINVTAILDGIPRLHPMSRVKHGSGMGEWSWPPRV